MKAASERTREWADKSERTKIGFDPIKEHERNISTRAYIGAKTKKMQSRVKQMEYRIGREIEEKEGLLQDLEKISDLKISPMTHHKETLVAASLLTPAHLYIWDEPLNFIDVFSRIQIENLFEIFRPTMLIVEHDVRFRDKIATKVIDM